MESLIPAQDERRQPTISKESKAFFPNLVDNITEVEGEEVSF